MMKLKIDIVKGLQNRLKDGPISQYCCLNDNDWLIPLLPYV